MGRKLKTRIPCHPEELKPNLPDYNVLRKKEKVYCDKMKENYNCRHRVTEGDQFSPGDNVWIPDLQTPGTVLENHSLPRSLVIQTPKSTVRRNRRMVRRSGAPTPPLIRCEEIIDVPETQDLTDVGTPSTDVPCQVTTPRKSGRTSVKPQRLIEDC